jgi:hypothetical protein
VDFVDEQQSALPHFAPRTGLVEHLLQIGDAGEDGADLHELQAGLVGKEPRHRGLAGAGRPPEDQRAERIAFQHAGQRAIGAEQMVLADHVGELLRPKLVGERPRRVGIEAGSREQVRARAALGAGGHRASFSVPMIIRRRWPKSAVRRAGW